MSGEQLPAADYGCFARFPHCADGAWCRRPDAKPCGECMTEEPDEGYCLACGWAEYAHE